MMAKEDLFVSTVGLQLTPPPVLSVNPSGSCCKGWLLTAQTVSFSGNCCWHNRSFLTLEGGICFLPNDRLIKGYRRRPPHFRVQCTLMCRWHPLFSKQSQCSWSLLETTSSLTPSLTPIHPRVLPQVDVCLWAARSKTKVNAAFPRLCS